MRSMRRSLGFLRDSQFGLVFETIFGLKLDFPKLQCS